MDGFNVLHPMGWDAFGLPAEQYAIKTGVHPAEVTRKNCQNFKRQLMLMGLSYDWNREIDTSDTKYYKWTQFLFLKLYERGLVYEKEENVWWCESLQTVLANEEVIDGRSERGDYPCIKKPLKQWVVKITEYAERLLADLDRLDWPESVKKMQREWIGRTEGIDIDLQVQDEAASVITLFTAEAESLYGANAVFLCAEHPYVKELCRTCTRDLPTRIASLQDPKVAVDGLFFGRHVRHPLTGALLPIYIANYLELDGREQAIFSVPEIDPKARALCEVLGLARLDCVQPRYNLPFSTKPMRCPGSETPRPSAVYRGARPVCGSGMNSCAIMELSAVCVTECGTGYSPGRGTGASPFLYIGTVAVMWLQPVQGSFRSSYRWWKTSALVPTGPARCSVRKTG